VVTARITWHDVLEALAAPAPRRLARASAAAVALILGDGPQGLDLLLVRRAEHPEDPWSGHMAFPGGRADPADADLLATAVRETAEEIGLDLAADAEALGALDDVAAMGRGRPIDLSIRPFVFRLRTVAELALSDEIAGAQWLPLTALLDPAHRAVSAFPVGGVTRELPCLHVGEHVIWGLTYRMFAGLASRLGAQGWTGAADGGGTPTLPEESR
jgi:8-oxo-dGTP pyrophosphatase MutT (NUDIX family)